ncbi:unnamed protein product, partial [Darwinula stevensoni]
MGSVVLNRWAAEVLWVSVNVLEEVIPDEDGAIEEQESETFPDENLAEGTERHVYDSGEGCVHEVAVLNGTGPVPLKKPSHGLVKEYKFVLDPFQKEAILCLENNQSVLVSAHTSAGKTVVAEYAVALALRQKQRVIYTTPIKALSNQKYREFYEEFQDVGLMTGDVTIHPNAGCLIMTTEILRSMLYRGSEVVREVGWVIFDEIHYMRDKERGYVWEETIILLPDSARFVFLSATIPNAMQFAHWICHLHKQPCHVVYTDYRPVPLQHYAFPCGGDGIHLVVDEKGQFREENFSRIMGVLQNAGDASKGDAANKGRKGGLKEDSNCYKIVKMVLERNMAPVIVFSFSKRDCELYALNMAKLDFNSSQEKKLVGEVFKNAMDILSEEDRKLPQVTSVLPLLQRGIGIHHGGLLPILKETIEILFSEGLIKALFATETFAMGLNMPARTVVFTSARKFDGKDYRWLSSGEYIQMSGRAGRRGLDEKGIVILMIDASMSPAIARNLLQGQADELNSSFRITYNMVLNLLRVEEINPEYVLERSFYQFQHYQAIPDLKLQVKKLEACYNSITVPDENHVSSYHQMEDTLRSLMNNFHEYITKPKYLVPFLQAGRMVHIVNKEKDFGWGVVVDFKKSVDATDKANPSYSVMVVLRVSKDTQKEPRWDMVTPTPKGKLPAAHILGMPLSLITEVSSVRVFIPKDLRAPDSKMSVLKTIEEVQKRFPSGLPLLDPIDDMGIKDEGLKTLVVQMKDLQARLQKHHLHTEPKLKELLSLYKEKQRAKVDLQAAKSELRKTLSVIQLDELKCRKRVLRRLKYCTSSDVIEVKGRVACELSCGDELLLTEMIFNGMFNEMEAAQIVALLSCLVCDEKSLDAPVIPEEIMGQMKEMQDLARRIARVAKDAHLDIDEELYVDRLKPYLLQPVLAWCRGASFAHVLTITTIFEGGIIRCMRRLEELLRQMCQAAKAIGNVELENKFAEGIRLLKRDIVFAATAANLLFFLKPRLWPQVIQISPEQKKLLGIADDGVYINASQIRITCISFHPFSSQHYTHEYVSCLLDVLFRSHRDRQESWEKLVSSSFLSSSGEKPMTTQDELDFFLKAHDEEKRKNLSFSESMNSSGASMNRSMLSAAMDYTCLLKKYAYQLGTAMSPSGTGGTSGGGTGGSMGGSSAEHSSPLSSGSSAEVWRRLGVSSFTVYAWTENIRKWLSKTIFSRLVTEMDSVNKALISLGHSDAQLGQVGLSQLKNLALSRSAHLPSLAVLVPYLEVHPNQEYVVMRIRELGRGGCLSEYRWDSGGSYDGKPWADHLPTDTALVMHAFATYFDCHLPPFPIFADGKVFSNQYFVKSPSKPISKDMPIIYQTQVNPPHFKFLYGNDTFEPAKGRNNLFYVLLLFLYHVKHKEGGMLGRVDLSLSGINVLWVYGLSVIHTVDKSETKHPVIWR